MSSPLSLPAFTPGIEPKLIFEFDCLIAVTAALLAVSSIAVALRVYVRATRFGWEDGTMMAAMFCYIITAALCFVATKAEISLVQGVVTMSTSALVQMIRYTNAAYALTMIFCKISIGIFFVKLFSSNYKWQRYLIYVLVGISSAFGVVYLAMTFATCGIMVRSQASTPLHTGSDWCPIQNRFMDISIVWSVLNAVTDITFQILSIQLIWNAKMSRATKMSATLLLLIGSIGGVASIARIVVQTPLQDIRLSGVLLGIWSNTEAGLCITAASLVTLRPMFQSILERTKLTLSSLTSRSNDSKRSASGSSEEIDMEKGLSSKNTITITRTIEIRDKDADSMSCSSF